MRKEQFYQLSNRIGALTEFETELRIASRESNEKESKELKSFANRLSKFRKDIEKYFINFDFESIEIKEFVYRNLDEEET